MQTEPSFSASQMQGSFDGVGKIVGDNVGLGDGDGVGLGVGDGDGDGVGDGVGEGVGEDVGVGVVGFGVGVFEPVHTTGGGFISEFRHAGHSSPFVHAEFGEKMLPLRIMMPQIPVSAPVNLLLSNCRLLIFVSKPTSFGIWPSSALECKSLF